MDSNPEATFARRLRDRDPEVVQEILVQFSSHFRTLAEKYGCEQEDLAQETLLRVWQGIERLDGDDQFARWLCGIAKNVALESARRRNHDALEAPETLAASPPDAPRRLADWEQAALDYISGLSEDKRTILERQQANPDRYAAELAEEFGIKASAVRARLLRLKREVEAHLIKIGCAPPKDWSLDRVLEQLAATINAGRETSEPLTPEQLQRVVEALHHKMSQRGPASPPDGAAQRQPHHRSYLPTGFETLDTLLGGRGLVRGSSVLLRGGAGTGKTTLALQIARHAIREEHHSFVYASVEDQPEVLLNHITRSFWNVEYGEYLGDAHRCHLRDLTDHFDTEVQDKAFRKFTDDMLRRSGLPADAQAIVHSSDDQDVRASLEALLSSDRVKEEVRAKVREMELDQLLRELWQSLAIDDDTPVLLVVDSLNALVSSAAVRFRAAPDRQILQAVFHAFRSWRRSRSNVTVLLIVEDSEQLVNTAASYVADTVIHLRAELIESSISERPGQEPRKWLQDLRFCQILKGRGLPIQRRSSCYEFVDRREESKRGIQFLPTYAAPGMVSLFYENAPMQEVIENLRSTDVPSTYPQVIVHEFSRSAIQRIFSVRRHSTQVSLRQPLILSNVDEHWLDVLRREDLLEPIAADKLECFSLPIETDDDVPSCFINELWTTKRDHFSFERDGKVYLLGVPQMANVGMLIYRKDVLDALGEKPPTTWEALENCCRSPKSRASKRSRSLLLETYSYDSFLTTALELIWSHGGRWRTLRGDDGRLRIDFDDGCGPANVVAALLRLKYWIHVLGIVPKESSIDPDVTKETDWLFARHWYSTWIDVRTRTPAIRFEQDAEFGVLPIPVAKAIEDQNGPSDSLHHSAWGEWYLAIQRGSENVELGVNLINNLMTARKITERALSGAAIPTVEKFYELADEICPETDLTFGQVRQKFFRYAKSRTEFDDYPRFSRVFSGVLRTITSNPRSSVSEAVKRAFQEIHPDFPWPNSDELQQQVRTLVGEEIARLL
ncbi:MAG: extracellular solute-binding protein [Pirellulaceae bacterium]